VPWDGGSSPRGTPFLKGRGQKQEEKQPPDLPVPGIMNNTMKNSGRVAGAFHLRKYLTKKEQSKEKGKLSNISFDTIMLSPDCVGIIVQM
jgi:hypothetical protein